MFRDLKQACETWAEHVWREDAESESWLQPLFNETPKVGLKATLRDFIHICKYSFSLDALSKPQVVIKNVAGSRVCAAGIKDEWLLN